MKGSGGRKGDKSNFGFPAEVGGSYGRYQVGNGRLVGLELSTSSRRLDSPKRVAPLKPEKTARSPLDAATKAIRTAKWATTMTKWSIGFETHGKRLGSVNVKPIRRWQLVSFPGAAGRESAGIVDILAIRKNHSKPKAPFKRGDLFEIILIQIKGGGAKSPDKSDIKRLSRVAKYYHARDVVLAEWVKGSPVKFYWLLNGRSGPKKAWGEVDPGVLFR